MENKTLESKETNEKFEWPPLESDPQIFNTYFHKIGLPEDLEFDELWSLDYKDVQPIENPIVGVVCAIRRPKGKYFIEDNLINYKEIPFYMKQEGSLDNACGLVASLHVFANSQDLIKIDENTVLGQYYKKCITATPEERCKILEDDNKFKEIHYQSAQEGQSSMPDTGDKIYYHYISFVNINNNLVELDGTLPGPVVIKKESTMDSLLDDTIEEIKKRISLGVISDSLSIILLKLI